MTIKIKKVLSIALFSLLIVFGMNSQIHSSATVVVNVSAIDQNKTTEELTIRELVDIFTRKQVYWADRTEIVVITRKQNSILNQEFLIEVLGITPYQYRSRLQRNLYRGRPTPPIEVEPEEEMFDLLIQNPESIGFLYDYILYKKEDRLVIIHVK